MELYCGEYTLRSKARKGDLRAWCAMQEILMQNSDLDHYDSQMYLKEHGYPMPTREDTFKEADYVGDLMKSIYSFEEKVNTVIKHKIV